MFKIQYLSFIVQYIIIFVNADTTLKPLEGQSMRSLLRGQKTQSSTYQISRSDFEDSAFIGYFKFNNLPDATIQSLMKLEVQQESYVFIHLFVNSQKQPTIKIIFDQKNVFQQYSLNNLSIMVNKWYILGIGYKYMLSNTYLIYGNPLDNTVQFQSYANNNQIDTRINQIQLCLACKPQEYIYSQFQGQYSTIKMITKFEVANSNSRFYLNENGMANLLRYSYQVSSDLQTFIKNQYPSTTFACKSLDKVYFDGICVDTQQCSSVQNQIQNQFGIQNSIYFNSLIGKCDICLDNCKICNNNSQCLECDFGYVIDNVENICKKCDQGAFYNQQTKSCSQTCPSGFQPDFINQICVQQFQPQTHKLQNLLAKRIFNQNDGFQMYEKATSNILPNQFSQCLLDENTYGDFTFLGSLSTLNTYQFRKTMQGFPKSPKKTISFIGVVYNNGNQNDFVLSINSKDIQLTSYIQIVSSSKNCAEGFDVNIYQLNYEILDSSDKYNIIISSKVNGWGIRNFSMLLTKCHPTCYDCINDSNPWSCTSCEKQSNVYLINNQCACSKGQYANFKNCYSPPCYECQTCPSYCNTCEDFSGKCTSCQDGYSIQNGYCVQKENCSVYYSNDSQSNYCIKSQDEGISHFGLNKITQYLDYWNFQSNGLFDPYLCFDQSFSPEISLASGQNLILQSKLQNFLENHYSIQIKINYVILGYQVSFLEFFIDDQSKGSFQYPTGTNSCISNLNNMFINSQSFTIYKSSDDIKYEMRKKDLTLSFDLIINNFSTIYNRCHASCKQCSDQKICTNCIPNASIQSPNTTCDCNVGYYFTYDWQNSTGVCMKCNFVCKTCSGPQASDCIVCSDGYQKYGNICAKCESNQYFDLIQKKCIECSECCKSCSGPSSNDCIDCQNLMILKSQSCYFDQILQCKSCNTAANGFCGGSQKNHDLCISEGWIIQNPSTCINCQLYQQNKCGGSQNEIICKRNGFYYSDDKQICLSCKQIINNQCGDSSISESCQQNFWINDKKSPICINCVDLDKDNNSCKICNSCKTCFGPFPDNCTTCENSKYLYKNQCKDQCPNGYKINSDQKICEFCTNYKGDSKCMTCLKPTCETCIIKANSCQPNDMQCIANNTQCQTCYPSMKLNNGICQCQDNEDNRANFYECSFNDQAVLDIILSNTSPVMTIDFGKVLEDLPYFMIGESSDAICQDIFDMKTLQLIGLNSKCKIDKNQIKIELNEQAEVMEGDFLIFKPEKLKFKNRNIDVYINKFLNNIVIQAKPNTSIVQFEYNQIQNSCRDFKIKLSQLLNDSGRGFKNITWKLINSVSDQEDKQIEQILQEATLNKKSSISIPKGIISLNKQKQIKVEYKLKNSFDNNQLFIFEVRKFKNININLETTLKTPSFIFQDFIVSLDYNIDYCDQNGKQIDLNDPVDISIECPQQPKLNIQKLNYSKNNLSFNVNKYSFIPETPIQIKAKITLTKENSIQQEQTFQFKYSKSNLIAKIVGGNRKLDYKKSLTLQSYLRDLDLEDPTIDQQIQTQWFCNDPSDDAKECITTNGNKLNLNQNLNILGGSFRPYSSIKITLKSKKDIRNSIHDIILLFLEYDLPLLDTDINIIDPFQKTVNLNEEISVKLNYQSDVNTDILSFSSTIVYENNVVGAIKFDYTQLRFQLWNYYSQFKRSNLSIQLRFSVFNPYYFMPSTQIIDLDINFPPIKCIFSIEPNQKNQVYSLKTKFVLSLNNCDDQNKPISYQFFMYKSQADLEFEIKNPLLIKRRQLNNLSLNSNLETILPAGDIILMAVASDSLQAVYNSTLQINVLDSKLNENQYLQIMNDALSISDQKTDEKISQLSLIAEDISLRKDLQYSAQINNKKIQIISALKNASQYLSSLSTFSTFSDKAIYSLLNSGITFNQNEQKQELQDIQKIFSDDWSNSYDKLTDTEKILKQQKIYDGFQIVDCLIQNTQQENIDLYNLQIDIVNKIGEKMVFNSLPNEDQRLFKGKILEIQAQQVTQKNLCNYYFCSNNNNKDDNIIQNPNIQPMIYNVIYKTHQNNPYMYDSSFQNLTQFLVKNLESKKLTKFPIISPDINLISDYHLRILNQNRNIQSSQDNINKFVDSNSITINFKNQIKESEYLQCLTRKKGEWTQKGCQLVQNEKKQMFSCVCQESNPTTIVDDLEEIIKNKNLEIAFGEQGVNNISNFTNFYKYIAFWLLSTLTASFIILFVKGKSLDNQQDSKIIRNIKKNKITPIQDFDQMNKLHRKSTLPITSNTLPLEIKQKANKEQLLKQPYPDSSTKVIQLPKIHLSQTPQNIDKHNGIVIDIQPLKQSEVQEIKEKQKISQNSQKQLKSNRRVSIQEHINEIEGVASCIDFKDEDKKMKTQTPTNLKVYSQSNIPELSDEEYTFKLQKFMDFNAFRQMVYFHSFFGIFLVFNCELPRSLRFSCFYVRLVHSLAISIIFDQQYNYFQVFALSLVNGLLVTIFIIILELISKKMGKFAMVFTLVCLLTFYYYIILTIISGQEPNISNLSMLNYLIVTICDLLFVAFLFAALQRYLALKTLQKQKLQTCSQRLFQLLQIQLILKSIL